jgi:hypothetical protein
MKCLVRLLPISRQRGVRLAVNAAVALVGGYHTEAWRLSLVRLQIEAVNKLLQEPRVDEVLIVRWHHHNDVLWRAAPLGGHAKRPQQHGNNTEAWHGLSGTTSAQNAATPLRLTKAARRMARRGSDGQCM